MLSLTFKELLDAVGFSGAEGTGGPILSDADKGKPQTPIYPKATVLLKNPVIKKAIARKLGDDYANKSQIAELFVNVNDTNLVATIRGHIRLYFDELRAGTGTDSSPIYKDRVATYQDPLYKMLVSIANDERIRSKAKANPTPSGASFVFNTGRYIIPLTSEEIAALDESDMASLASAGAHIGDDMIMPKSAIFMTDKKYGPLYRNSPYPTFTGIDMQIITMTPHVITQNMTLKTLTYSMHAGLIPVSSLGRDRPKGYAKGSRTIAGTMIATVTVNDPLMDLQPILYASNNDYAKSTSDIWRTYLLPDQFPLFDILVIFNNEYGFNAALPIYGIKFTDTGQVMSMQDSEIEVTYTYTALDIDVIRSLTGQTNADGTMTTFDPLANNEYLVKRERAYKGISMHRSAAEVPSLYARMDSRAREIEYNELRNKGIEISDIIQLRGILEGK